MTQLTVQPKTYSDYSSKKYNKQNNNQQSFKGAADVLTASLQFLDKNPMLNVGFIDTVSTDFPRTLVDLKTGIPAALETARREFSGLIVNCLIPSFFVLGVGKLLNKPFMNEFKGLDMSGSWANQDSIEALTKIYSESNADNRTKDFVQKTIKNLQGFDENKFVDFENVINKENFDKAVDIVSTVIDKEKVSKKEIKQAIEQAHDVIVKDTKASEVIKFIKDDKAFSSNLSDLLRDQIDLGRKFAHNGFTNVAENGAEAVTKNLTKFTKKATDMVNAKSLIGLGIIIPLAMSVQSINRAITRKKYNQKGAPIYKDFEKGTSYRELTGAEKSKFFAQKCVSASAMVGLAVLSMMKKPSLKMLQFKGMFPTLDQCRWIATATFASRMFASEDPNELRESTVRDIASFSGLYFLGDYAAKATATLIEKIKPDVKLLNRLKPDDKAAALPKRFWNWVKNYQLKSFDEVKGPNAKNLRSLSQLASLAFSVVFLGILLPKYNRSVTEKKVAARKAAEAAQAKTQTSISNTQPLPKAFTGIEKFAR